MEQMNIMRQDTVTMDEATGELVIIDQTRLPGETVFLRLSKSEDIHEAIYKLRVRGAPAIGVAAAIGIAAVCLRLPEDNPAVFREEFFRVRNYLVTARPTAVNLAWALRRMEGVLDNNPALAPAQLLPLLRAECQAILDEDIAMCRKISEYGLSLLKEGDGVLTHCNAGPIATSQYGTATGPILLGRERGMNFRVFADETRPLLQGARLTAYELQKAGVDVTLICDNMASVVMKNGWVQACFVGCDRVAANGDFANKIGTSGVAILAKHYGIPFYTLGPTSTIDMNCPDGDHIAIEQRDPAEIREKFYEKPMALPDVKCFNPAFDVTDHTLVTGIVTEKGICYPPFTESLKKLFET